MVINGNGKHTTYKNGDNWYLDVFGSTKIRWPFFQDFFWFSNCWVTPCLFPGEVAFVEVGNGSRSTQRSHPGADGGWNTLEHHLTKGEVGETLWVPGYTGGPGNPREFWSLNWKSQGMVWQLVALDPKMENRPRRTQLGGTAATQAQEHKVKTIEDEIAVKEAPCLTDQWWLSSTSHLRQQLIFVFSNSQRYHEGMAPSCL